jgi:large subunit ribosomal protein L25
MLTLQAKIREESGKKTDKLRKSGLIPAILYGPGLKENLNLQVDAKEFTKAYQGAGHSSFIKLEVEGKKAKPQTFLVLIHALQKEPLSLSFSHIDFYQPDPDKEVKVKIPLVFEGESAAVKSLGAVLVKNIQEVEVRALPENLPHQILVNLSPLEEIGNAILVKDLNISKGVKILKSPEEIVVLTAAPEKIEEELAKPVEEKVEEVKVVEKEKKEKETGAEVAENEKSA